MHGEQHIMSVLGRQKIDQVDSLKQSTMSGQAWSLLQSCRHVLHCATWWSVKPFCASNQVLCILFVCVWAIRCCAFCLPAFVLLAAVDLQEHRLQRNVCAFLAAAWSELL